MKECIIKIQEDLSVHAHEYLFLLYKPLIGTRAVELYEIMQALAGKPISNEDLLDFTNMSENQLAKTRRKLEHFMLLSTYQNNETGALEYHLYAPLAPRAFLQHDIFGRLIINNLSAGRYKRLTQLYDVDLDVSGLTNLTESMPPEDLDDKWSQAKEKIWLEYLPTGSDLSRFPFDWDLFFRGMERSFPERLRTKENLVQIASLAHVYGVGEEDMRKIVNRAIPSDRSRIQFDVVTESLLGTSKIIRQDDAAESISNQPHQDLLKIPDEAGMPAVGGVYSAISTPAAVSASAASLANEAKGSSAPTAAMTTEQFAKKKKGSPFRQKAPKPSISPISYYASTLAPGTFPLPSERKLIAKLTTLYHFSDEVAVELLRHCLQQCDGRLVERYVEKAAASWYREHIQDVEQAKAYMEKQKPAYAKEAPLPDWYYQQETTEATPQMIEEAMRAMRIAEEGEKQ